MIDILKKELKKRNFKKIFTKSARKLINRELIATVVILLVMRRTILLMVRLGTVSKSRVALTSLRYFQK